MYLIYPKYCEISIKLSCVRSLFHTTKTLEIQSCFTFRVHLNLLSIFQMVSSHIWLVNTILDGTALE